jgi:hypothetical protein
MKMVDTGHRSDNVENVVDNNYPGPPVIIQKQVKTVASMYPARLVGKDTNDHGMKICDGVNVVPVGWLGHEQTDVRFRQDAKTTIQVVNNKAACLRGGGFCIQAAVPKGFAVRQGDIMFSAGAAGQVVPGFYVDGKPAMAIPYSKNATQTDTNVDLIAGQIVTDCLIFCETVAGGSSIDVGIGMGAESGYDIDGFVDGELASVAGLIDHLVTWTTGSNNVYLKQAGDTSRGALIATLLYGADAAQHEDGSITEIAYKCDGTCVSIDYTTSSHTIAGRIMVVFGRNPGIMEVGRSEITVDCTSAADDCWVLSTL